MQPRFTLCIARRSARSLLQQRNNREQWCNTAVPRDGSDATNSELQSPLSENRSLARSRPPKRLAPFSQSRSP